MSDKNPKIKFGGVEIPTYEAWSKLEAAQEALDILDRFNQRRAELATTFTRDTAEEVRKRLSHVEIIMPQAPKKSADLEEIVRALLMTHTPEDVIDILQRDHGIEADIHGLIHLAGTEAYLQSLANEVDVFQQNRISFDQIASLWNEAKRPAPGKPFWDKRSVEDVFRERGGGEG
jgi:hypothetical protein